MKRLSFVLLVFLSSMFFSNTSEARTLLLSTAPQTVCATAIESIKETNDPLIIIDGKEASKTDLDQLDPNTIDSVSVLKSEKAIEKYGEKGKNGVIEVVTKKNQPTKL